MKLKDMKIGTQLYVSMVLRFAFVLVLGAVAWRHTTSILQRTDALHQHPFQVRTAIGALEADILTTHGAMKGLALAADEREIEAGLQEIEARTVDAHRQLDLLHDRYLGPRSDIDSLRDELARWDAARAETIRLFRAGRTAAAIARIGSGGEDSAQAVALMVHVRKIDDFALRKGDQLVSEATAAGDTLNRQLAAIVAVILLLSLAVTYLLERSIKAPLLELSAVAERFRRGELDARSSFVSANEYGTLSAAFNVLADTVQSEWQSRDSAARMAEIMLEQEELHAFCRELLKALLEHTPSQVGAVYVLNEEKTSFEHCESIGLSPAGRVAFSAGGLEGELGAAVATRKIERITDIPADSRFTLATVSGEFVPREIITIPIVTGADVVAVVSLASVQGYPPRALRLVNDVWNMITARMNGVLAFGNVSALAQRLERQNAELEAQKNELAAQTMELQRQASTLNEQNIELELQAAQVAEANRLKSEFLSNMSHELRTPLNSVLALSRVLQMQGKERLTPEQAGYLEIIERNGKHLLSLINDILDLAKIESGRLEVTCEELSLGEQIGAVAESLEPICREKGITLAVNVDPALPRVWSDQRRVHTILQNIVGNAVKFTRAGRVSVTARGRGEEAEIVVADTGIGIPENDLPHIFDEFRQVDGTTARSFEGTGLGLAIAAKSVRLLGGRIAVRSTLGAGSTFTITLPLARAMADLEPAAAGAAPAPVARPGKTVLVVDDDVADASVVAAYLAQEGYDTLTAHSGREALQLAAAHRPFAITLDVIMPEMDGWEVLQALKTNPATANIPVIIVSISEDRGTGLALGAIGVVAKPVDRDALLAEVRRVAPPGPASVLVVDDSDVDRRLMTAMLETAGFQVLEAVDGPECLGVVAGHSPDVVLLDLVMPGMSGFEVLDALRNDPGTRHVPVVIVTAHDLSVQESEHLQGRASALVEKSRLASGDLLAEIGRILERLGRAPAAPPSRGNRILLVEDSEPAIVQIKALLDAAGYAVDVARGGREALVAMAASPPDGIILDLMMPEVDGLAVLERMRGTPATARTPVLILTAKDLTPDDLARLSANNVQQLIQKGDVDRDELLRQVGRLLGRKPEAAAPGVAPGGRRRARPPAGRQPVILAVEDNADSMSTLRAILRDRCVLLEAGDGDEGLRRALRERPDLVLLDLSLPKLDGLAVVRRLREAPSTREIPVIALTAHSMKGDREKALEAGCDDYLPKPIEVESLLGAVERWIGRSGESGGHER